MNVSTAVMDKESYVGRILTWEVLGGLVEDFEFGNLCILIFFNVRSQMRIVCFCQARVENS